MPLKQFPPPPQKKPPGMSHHDWMEHLEEVKAGEKRFARQSVWRSPKPAPPRLKVVKD